MANTFYDIHMHAMDLSHPNLLAFMQRISGLGPKLILGGLVEPFLNEKEKNFVNLLTVMENSIEDYFCLMEYFLKSKEPVVADGIFQAANTDFRTILLTPLIMDFGLKNIKTKTFYDVAVGKPVVEQSADILRAIAKYCSCEVVPIAACAAEFDKKNSEASKVNNPLADKKEAGTGCRWSGLTYNDQPAVDISSEKYPGVNLRLVEMRENKYTPK